MDISLQQLKEELSASLFDVPVTAENRIRDVRLKLLSLRQNDLNRTFEYAIPLTQATADATPAGLSEERETFFSSIVLLIDRQPEDSVRCEVLQLLAELGAIEYDHAQAGNRTEIQRDKYSFGKHSFQVLLDLMPSVVNIKEPFLNMVHDHLVTVVNGIEDHIYFINILPMLIGMCNDPKFGYDVANAFLPLSDKFINMLKFSRNLARYAVINSTENGICSATIPALPDENMHYFRKERKIDLPMVPRATFSLMCELMSMCAMHSDIADIYHLGGDTGISVSLLLAAEKIKYISDKDEADTYCGECAVHRLMASMARSCSAAAQQFTKPVMDSKDGFIFRSLVRDIKSIGDDQNRAAGRIRHQEHMSQHGAFLVSVLNGILINNPASCELLAKEINATGYITNLMKIAKSSPGALASAALEGLLVITRTKELEKFRTTMENECDLAAKLQEIIKNLLVSMKSWNNASREAIISSLSLMKKYTQIPAISKQLNKSDFDGYDREAIVFKILDSKDPMISDEVKFAASEVLSVVPLEEFDKGEIRQVVDMIAAVPALVSYTTYDIITNILFLMFKMAMDTGGDNPQDADESSCGDIFRDIYATEVVSAVFGNIARAMESDIANTAQSVDYRKRRFETASVKLLQTAWKQSQLRQGMQSDDIVSTLVTVMKVEQALLAACSIKRFVNFEHLYIEQTWVGNNVANMLRCVRSLKSRDVVAFRCFHQMANILSDIQYYSVLDELTRAATSDDHDAFDAWGNGIKCGTDIDTLAENEMKEWTSTASLSSFVFSISELQIPKKDGAVDVHKVKMIAHRLAEVQASHARRVYKVTKEVPELAEKWEKTLIDVSNEPRIVHLIMEDYSDPNLPKLVAFCGGGPLRKLLASGVAELYSMCYNPMYSSTDAIQTQLLAVLSHNLFTKGFKSCQAWIHNEEQILYANTSGTTWANQHEQSQKANEKKTEEKTKLIMREQIKLKPLLYQWSLKHNIWKTSNEHRKFLEEHGIETMVHFLAKPDDMTLNDANGSDGEGIQKSLERTMSTTIRSRLESHGQELMGILESRGQANEENLEEKMRKLALDLDGPGLSKFFETMENEFHARGFNDELPVNNIPMWNSQLSGTDLENFLQTVTIGLEKGTRIEEVIRLAKKERADDINVLEEVDPKYRKARFMGIQLMPNIAAMLRAFHALLNGGSYEIRKEALKALRNPSTFYAIRLVVSSVNYGIRRTVREKLSDEYGVGMKFLSIITQLIHIFPKGLQQSLPAVEFFELMIQTLEDVFSRLVRLVKSRNEDAEDPLHKQRALYRYEESLISEACRATSDLINQVSFIQFFDDATSTPKIYEGAVILRQLALTELFAKSNSLKESLLNFLLYDLELSSALRPAEQPTSTVDDKKADDSEHKKAAVDEKKLGIVFAKGYYRDRMRVQILDILGQLTSFDDGFRYKFVSEYCKGLVEAELGLRKSFVQSVLSIAKSRKFRSQLEGALIRDGVFEDDEEILVDHAFLEHLNSGKYKLLVLTNKAWYISSASFQQESIDLNNPEKFSFVEKHDYSNILQIHRGYGGKLMNPQFFAIEYLDVQSQTPQRNFLVLVHRVTGVVERLLNTFCEFCLDDLSQSLIPIEDGFTQISVGMAITNSSLSFEKWKPQVSTVNTANEKLTENEKLIATRQFHEDLFTFVHIIEANQRIERILAWSTNAQSDDDYSFAKHNLLELSCDLSQWRARIQAKGIDKNPRILNFLKVERVYDLKRLESVDFLKTSKPMMVMEFRAREKGFLAPADGKISLAVEFACDTAREQWRRYLAMIRDNDYDATDLPDLHHQDKHSGKII